MRWIRAVAGIVVALCAVPSLAGGPQQGHGPDRASLVTVEGTVSSVERIPAEEGGPLEVARVELDEPGERAMSIALAPEETLQQIGFEVRPGDRLRAKIFLSTDAPVLAHKVLNVTRGTMVRLRTLTRVPLWDQQGRWQGGPCRTQHGGPRHRGGRH